MYLCQIGGGKTEKDKPGGRKLDNANPSKPVKYAYLKISRANFQSTKHRWLQRTLESRRQREEGRYDEIAETKEDETTQGTIPQRKKGYGALGLTKEP